MGMRSSHFLQQIQLRLRHHEGMSLHVMLPRKGCLISLLMSFFISSPHFGFLVSLHASTVGETKMQRKDAREGNVDAVLET